jgi:hypothetical protein
MSSSNEIGPRRVEKIKRYKHAYALPISDDQLQEYMNILGMVFSMCGLMMKVSVKRNKKGNHKSFQISFIVIQYSF